MRNADNERLSTPMPTRRGRGRPRKDGTAHKGHPPEHFDDIRLRRDLARIIHKQFLILRSDVPEAKRRLSDLIEKANSEFSRVTREVNEAIGKEPDGRLRNREGKFVRTDAPEEPVDAVPAEIDPLDDLPPVEMPMEPQAHPSPLPEKEVAVTGTVEVEPDPPKPSLKGRKLTLGLIQARSMATEQQKKG